MFALAGGAAYSNNITNDGLDNNDDRAARDRFQPSLEAVESSLYEALERSGNRPVRALQRLRAVLLTAEQAELLGAEEKDAGLLVERLGFHKDGRAVEFAQSYYRGDIYDFVAELSAST